MFQQGAVYTASHDRQIIGLVHYHAQQRFIRFMRYLPPLPKVGDALLLRRESGEDQAVRITRVSTNRMTGESLFSYA
jgi:hypothetical protein